jgi:hypothetical protein
MHTSDTRILQYHSLGSNLVPNSQAVQDPGHIWRELDASTDEAEIRGRLENLNVLEAFLGESEGTSKTAHAWRLLEWLENRDMQGRHTGAHDPDA